MSLNTGYYIPPINPPTGFQYTIQMRDAENELGKLSYGTDHKKDGFLRQDEINDARTAGKLRDSVWSQLGNNKNLFEQVATHVDEQGREMVTVEDINNAIANGVLTA